MVQALKQYITISQSASDFVVYVLSSSLPSVLFCFWRTWAIDENAHESFCFFVLYFVQICYWVWGTFFFFSQTPRILSLLLFCVCFWNKLFSFWVFENMRLGTTWHVNWTYFSSPVARIVCPCPPNFVSIESDSAAIECNCPQTGEHGWLGGCSWKLSKQN